VPVSYDILSPDTRLTASIDPFTVPKGNILNTASLTMPIAGKGPMLVAVLWSQNFLSAIFIGLRLYTRTCVITRFGWDDYALIATWVSC